MCTQLAGINVANEEPNRRALREMLFRAEGIENYIRCSLLHRALMLRACQLADQSADAGSSALTSSSFTSSAPRRCASELTIDLCLLAIAVRVRGLLRSLLEVRC